MAPRHCEINPRSHILVADDDEDIRRINTELLREAGYQVESVTDGAAAWDALQQNRYDLLLTDNSMPKMSGCELIENLKEAGISLPVIMVTGVVPPPVLFQKLQIEALLLKPYTADELLAKVWNVLHVAAGDINMIAPLSAAPGSTPDGMRVRKS